MSKHDENIGLVAVENFSKFAHIAVIKNKQPDEIIRGLKEIINKMGKPKQLYSDEEGSFNALIFDFLMKLISSMYRQPHMHILLKGLYKHLEIIYSGD